MCVLERKRSHNHHEERERKGENKKRACTSKVDRETPNPSYHTKKGEMGVTNPSPTKEKNTARAHRSREGSRTQEAHPYRTNQFFYFFSFFLSSKSA